MGMHTIQIRAEFGPQLFTGTYMALISTAYAHLRDKEVLSLFYG